jgi:hypothetical protein
MKTSGGWLKRSIVVASLVFLVACSTANSPHIRDFFVQANDLEINLIVQHPETGETYVKLAWDVAGPKPMTVTLDPGNLDVSAFPTLELNNLKVAGKPVAQGQTISYVLTAKNAYGVDTATLELVCCRNTMLTRQSLP